MQVARVLFLGLLAGACAQLASAQDGIGPITTGVPFANHHVGHPSNKISPGFLMTPVAIGKQALENPSGPITRFGLLSDGTHTEPDQNTYAVTPTNPGGPVPGYDYGRHFLIQGHENGDNLAYVTRINLDVTDPKHRITLLTPVGPNGNTGFNSIDGSTLNPFTRTLLFTEEDDSSGGVIELHSTWPPAPRVLDGIFGRAGYEGIRVDDQGNIYLVEDTGGVSVNVDPNDPNSPKVAKQPNSFVYRLIPYNKKDLSKGGKLQALQVLMDGEPLVFHADDPVGDVFSVAQLRLHTPGTSYPVQWVTIHDTAVNGTDAFDANALAKSGSATPFKRPENMSFAPGSRYHTFFFCPTGDTNADAGNVPDLAERGAWGSIFRVDLVADGNSGELSIFVLGDADHSSFDNLALADSHTLMATEDRGDTLHGQLNKLDSVWAYSLDGSEPPLRFVALGRDTDSEQGGEDNEPTGLAVSNGVGLVGSQANLQAARAFVTQQHGKNTVFEIFNVQ